MSSREPTPAETRRRNLVRHGSDPRTPASWLAAVPWAVDRSDKALRDALAANPSTPPPTLAKLVEHSPEAFCRNPAASLVAIETPAFLRAVSDTGVARLLRCAQAPHLLVAGVAAGTGRHDPLLVDAARFHLTQAPEIPDLEWAGHIRDYWREVAGSLRSEAERHAVLELVELDLLPAGFRLCVHPDPLPLDTRAMPHHPGTPPSTLAALARHADAVVRRQALHDPTVSPALVEQCRQRALKRLLHADPVLSLDFSTLLGRFSAMRQAPVTLVRPRLLQMGTSLHWQDRMAAALAIGPRPSGQPARPRHILLLHQLAEDGIVLVRAAARAHLRGESFTW